MRNFKIDMVSKIQLTFIFAFTTNLLFGQIFLAFHLNDTLDIKNKKVNEICEELKMGNGTIKYFKTINNRNQVISDERHDNNGKFIVKFTYTYDSLTALKKSETKEFADKMDGRSSSTEKYEYSSDGRLKKITYLGENNSIYQMAVVTNNERGHPIKIETFTESGVLTGSETANYKYNENKASFEKLDSNGTVIYSSFFILDHNKEKNTPKPGFVYDEKGSLIKTPDGYNTIVYDKYENWTSIKMFAKVKGVDKLTQEQTRTIKYAQ